MSEHRLSKQEYATLSTIWQLLNLLTDKHQEGWCGCFLCETRRECAVDPEDAVFKDVAWRAGSPPPQERFVVSLCGNTWVIEDRESTKYDAPALATPINFQDESTANSVALILNTEWQARAQ